MERGSKGEERRDVWRGGEWREGRRRRKGGKGVKKGERQGEETKIGEERAGL